jgi:Porin subfamily/DcaP outer membrane protein
MMKGRKIATIAALGTSTAALAMLTGLAGARADELSDLRLNQQLLSQRIDQLAATGLYPDVFSVNTNPAASAPATAGSFPRSILIPGTDTSLKVYGQITEVLDYWMSGGPPNSSPQTTTVGDNGQVQAAPLNNAGPAKARSNGVFSQSPKESKIGFETRTPTPLGEVRTVFEFDWAGSTSFAPGGTNPTSVSDNIIPRLRYAYGTLGGFLAGQATSNFSDPDANAETLDFGGNVGEPGHVRIPQVRYTIPLTIGSFSVSAETPETDIATPGGIMGSDAGVIPTITTAAPACTIAGVVITCTAPASTLLASGQLPLNVAKATAPDFTAAWYLPQSWGHLDISAVIRPGLDVTDGKFFARDFIGYGGHFGMDFKPGWFGWAKDDFTAHFTLGEALGSYLNSSGNFALATNYGTPGGYGAFGGPATAAAAAAILVKPTFEWGSELGYQHWWADNLRSNINAGINIHQIPGGAVASPSNLIGAAQSGALNKELLTFHTNLIWSPVSMVDVGIEYMWGQRTTVNNLHGTENALISKFAFRF